MGYHIFMGLSSERSLQCPSEGVSEVCGEFRLAVTLDAAGICASVSWRAALFPDQILL